MNIKQIIKTRIHSMTRAEAYHCFTTPEKLKHFFGREHHIDIRLFGPYEIYFLEAPLGSRGSEGCQVLAFIPNRLLSFTWNAPPSFPEIRNSESHTFVVLEFEDEHIRLTHGGWPSDESWDKVYDYFDEAWDVVLDRFAEMK
ncbi:MAG: SRPBCC domain-containing protein [Clostridia bacterium]|nr:SRPBCC domain-containing protein [Clostridia bacterium]